MVSINVPLLKEQSKFMGSHRSVVCLPSGAAIPQGVISPTAKGRRQPLGLSENVAQPPASQVVDLSHLDSFGEPPESSSFAQASTSISTPWYCSMEN